MDTSQFWQLLEKSRQPNGNHEQRENLQKLLAELDAAEILEFDRIFVQLMIQSYRPDLWAVAYIINGRGCSDAGFVEFRYWLISQGREYFEAALENPERAADALERGQYAVGEWISGAGFGAYCRKYGEEPPELEDFTQSWLNQPCEDDDLESLFPKLWAKFCGKTFHS